MSFGTASNCALHLQAGVGGRLDGTPVAVESGRDRRSQFTRSPNASGGPPASDVPVRATRRPLPLVVLPRRERVPPEAEGGRLATVRACRPAPPSNPMSVSRSCSSAPAPRLWRPSRACFARFPPIAPSPTIPDTGSAPSVGDRERAVHTCESNHPVHGPFFEIDSPSVNPGRDASRHHRAVHLDVFPVDLSCQQPWQRVLVRTSKRSSGVP